MDKDEIIRQLMEQNEQLKRENEFLRARIAELEARLAQYENAHTPPSLKRGRRPKNNVSNKGKPGQKTGHKGVTRPLATPDSQEEIAVCRYPNSRSWLGTPFRIESKNIEEIQEPQPVMVTEYKIGHYRCPHCQREVIANDASCPHKGKFGNNMIAQATLLKYEDRLPHRKIQSAMKRMMD